MSSGEYIAQHFRTEEPLRPTSYWKNPDGEVIAVVSHWKEAVIEFREQRDLAKVAIKPEAAVEEVVEETPLTGPRSPIGLEDWGQRRGMVIDSQSAQIIESRQTPVFTNV